MIIGAAVCPGAPFLLPGAADSIAAGMRTLATACTAAINRLPPSDSIVLLSPRWQGAGEPSVGPSRWLPADSAIELSSVRRSDLLIPALTLPSGSPSPGPPLSSPLPPGAVITDPAVGTMVGAVLLHLASCRPPVTIVEVGTDPAAVAVLLDGTTQSDERVALLVIADGSACHGDQAPGKRDDRAAGFDAAVAAALVDGSPGQLASACADRSLARSLLATVGPLAVLARLTQSRAPDAAELLYSAAPFGVGYWVASWRWTIR
ncbi:MAG: hypothetical protein ABJD68_12200 [Nakamurella sp.]